MTKIDLQFPDADSLVVLDTEVEGGPESLRRNEIAFAIALTQESNVQVANVLEGIVGAPLTASVLQLASESVTRSELLTQLFMALGGKSDLATVVNELMPKEVASDVPAEAEKVDEPVAEVEEVVVAKVEALPAEPVVVPEHAPKAVLRPPMMMRPAEGSRTMASPLPVIDPRTVEQLAKGVFRRRAAKPAVKPMGFLKI